MHHIPLAHHDSSHDLAAVCPAPAPPVPHVHSITQSRTQSVVRTVCEPGSAEALSLSWLQKAASHDLGIHASAFLNHWTSGTLSLQGRQVSQSVLIVSSAGVRMEMIDPAPTLPAFLETTPPAWTENRLAWLPVFGTRLRTGFWARTVLDSLRHHTPRTEIISATSTTTPLQRPVLSLSRFFGFVVVRVGIGLVGRLKNTTVATRRCVVHTAAPWHPHRGNITPWTRPEAKPSPTTLPVPPLLPKVTPAHRALSRLETTSPSRFPSSAHKPANEPRDKASAAMERLTPLASSAD